MSEHIADYLRDVTRIISNLSVSDIQALVDAVRDVRDRRGRLFVIGVGGGAAHASHAVNDLRKIAGIESYAPIDNVSELTARINDEGWDTCFSEWLRGSQITSADAVLVFSVGGGSVEQKVSMNVVRALELAEERGAGIFGIVGRDGGYTARVANACVVVPTTRKATLTAHTEGLQSVIWHLLISHPDICVHEMKWESLD